MSIFVLCMTMVMLRTGIENLMGIASLAAQIGLLARMNYVHRKQVQRQKETAGR